MGELFYALDKGFQRLMRWAYPGILFLILWYASNPKKFIDITKDIGFPEYTVWGLLIGGLGIGAVIYLLQVYVFTTILNIIHSRWNRSTPEHNPTSSNCFMKFIDGQAELIRGKSQVESKLDAYMDYNWSICHALFITAWLTPIFYCSRVSQSILSCLSLWHIVVFSVVLVVFAWYLYFRLIRVQPEQKKR